MQTLTLTAHVGADGILRLEVPIGLTDTAVEVVLVVQPRPPHPDWPPGFFDHVAGGWQGPPLERAPQGEHEQREPHGGPVIGSIDDPTFVRHPQGEYEQREPFE